MAFRLAEEARAAWAAYDELPFVEVAVARLQQELDEVMAERDQLAQDNVFLVRAASRSLWRHFRDVVGW